MISPVAVELFVGASPTKSPSEAAVKSLNVFSSHMINVSVEKQTEYLRSRQLVAKVKVFDAGREISLSVIPDYYLQQTDKTETFISNY